MSKSEFGDFEEIQTEQKPQQQTDEQQMPQRVRFPRNNQLIGIVLERLGGKRMSIKSSDGKTRNCRVPGRFSRKFWLRPGDAVIIQPWPDNDDKGDIVYQYRKPEFYQLKKRGLLDNLQEKF